MMKLIRLEWKKNNILKFVRNAAIMTAVIALLILPMAGELQREEIDASYLYGKGIVGTTVELFVDIAYIVFTAIMLASFIVSAYTKKTMHLMFSYPIKRRKILLSQMAAVWIFNMTAMIASKLLIYAILLLSSPVLGISMAEIQFGSLSFWLDLLIRSAAMVSITYISLPVGLRMKSSKATIVTAVILVLFTQGNVGTVSLVNNTPFFVVLFVLSAVSVYLSVFNAETKDLL
ncbi:MAG: ABC transporter permease [Lachnospiraceae bacterium]|jgi:ABC-type transport system involved in multi-copper enzyme maturation permease subunit|nr:ABC transporter permease [Lachnospiraceae bacterium]